MTVKGRAAVSLDTLSVNKNQNQLPNQNILLNLLFFL
jgi:hypothetical protein